MVSPSAVRYADATAMKNLHRDDFFAWSRFDEERDLDFHSVAIVRESGNVLVDPLPLSDHDAQHLSELGGAACVVVTNSDHLRSAVQIAEAYGAELVGPAGESAVLPPCRTVADGDTVAPGLVAFEMHGSKTPGELALVLDGTTLITGDLIRGHRGGKLNLLPAAKLSDEQAARDSVRRLVELGTIETVIVGDGWHVWREGTAALRDAIAG